MSDYEGDAPVTASIAAGDLQDEGTAGVVVDEFVGMMDYGDVNTVLGLQHDV